MGSAAVQLAPWEEAAQQSRAPWEEAAQAKAPAPSPYPPGMPDAAKPFSDQDAARFTRPVGQPAQQPAAAAPPSFWRPIASAASSAASSVAHTLGLPGSMAEAREMSAQQNADVRAHPVERAAEALAGPAGQIAEGLYAGGKRSLGELEQGAQAVEEGNPTGAAVHAVQALPFVGAGIKAGSEQLEPGQVINPAEFGTALGTALQVGPMLAGGEAEGRPNPNLGVYIPRERPMLPRSVEPEYVGEPGAPPQPAGIVDAEVAPWEEARQAQLPAKAGPGLNPPPPVNRAEAITKTAPPTQFAPRPEPTPPQGIIVDAQGNALPVRPGLPPPGDTAGRKTPIIPKPVPAPAQVAPAPPQLATPAVMAPPQAAPAQVAPNAPQDEQRPVVQASTEPEQIQQSAEQQKPVLKDMAETAVDGVPGAKVEGMRVKKPEAVENKEERGKPPETITDHLGARVSAPTPEGVEQVKQNIESQLPVHSADKITNNGVNADQYGVQTGLPGEPNQVSELQVTTAPVAKAMKETDDLYDQQKKALAAGDQAKADELGAQIEAKMRDAQQPGGAKERFRNFLGDAIKRMAQDQEGQGVLDDMEEAGISPRDVSDKFWRDTYFNLPDGAQETFRRYLKKETGFQPGDTIGTKANGSPIVATDWQDIAKQILDLPDKTEHLEGTTRGLVALMKTANDRFPTRGGADAQQPENQNRRALSESPEQTQLGNPAPLKAGDAVTYPATGGKSRNGKIVRVDGDSAYVRDGFATVKKPVAALQKVGQEAPQQNQSVAPQVAQGGTEAPKVAQAGTPPATGDKWIGVDLDGTLAKYDGWKGKTNIGEPIPAMVDRIKQSLADGNNVKILTARVSDDPTGEAKKAIQDWTEKHLGKRLDVTDVKDAHMTHLYDDRAVPVERNTGKLLAEPQPEGETNAIEPRNGGEPSAAAKTGSEGSKENALGIESTAAVGTHEERTAGAGGTVSGPRVGQRNELQQPASEESPGQEKPLARTGGGEKPEEVKETKYQYGNTQAAIPKGSDAHTAITALQNKVADADLMAKGKDVDEPHVTVRYGIQGDDTSGIRSYIEKQAPFDAKLGRTEIFPPTKNSDGAAVVVAPVVSPNLNRMNAEIEKAGDFKESDFPEYKPHATVAYVNPDAAGKYKGMTDAEGKTFRISSVDISDRDGNKEAVRLKGKPTPAFYKSKAKRVTSGPFKGEEVPAAQTAIEQHRAMHVPGDFAQLVIDHGKAADKLTALLKDPNADPKELAAAAAKVDEYAPAMERETGNAGGPVYAEDLGYKKPDELTQTGGAAEPAKRAAAPATEYLHGGIGAVDLSSALPKPIRDYLEEKAGQIAGSRELQTGMYNLESQHDADVLRAVQLMKEMPGTPRDFEAIYHNLENPKEPLTRDQRNILNQYIKPLMDADQKIFEKLNPTKAPVENYVHRIAQQRGSQLERILKGSKGTGGGNLLKKSNSASKKRTMMALERPDGERQVVSVSRGRVTAWTDGVPRDIGPLRSGLTNPEEILDERLEPIERELAHLRKEQSTLSATKSRQEAASRRLGNIANRISELEKQSNEIEHEHIAENLPDRLWKDKSGTPWTFKQATTKDIEANSPVAYYKNAAASAILNHIELRKAERAYDFIENFKNDPEFGKVGIKPANPGQIPEGWKPATLPQFMGYYFEPHIADTLDWYAKRLNKEPGVWEQINNFLTTSIFLNPIAHIPNLTANWVAEKGIELANPMEMGSQFKSGLKAISAVAHQNKDFLEALDAGAALHSQKQTVGQFTDLLMKKLQDDVEKPGVVAKLRDAMGDWLNPVTAVKTMVNAMASRITWPVHDFYLLQSAYSKMANRPDLSLKDALEDTGRYLPNERVPVHIMGSKAISSALQNRSLVIFNAYHYGVLKAFGQVAKNLGGMGFEATGENAKGEPTNKYGRTADQEKFHALNILAGMAILTYVIYPQIDRLMKVITGNNAAEFRRAGYSTMVHAVEMVLKGERTPVEAIRSAVTPAPLTELGLDLATDRDILGTQRRIYDPHGKASDIAQEIGGRMAESFSPGQYYRRATTGPEGMKNTLWDLAGVSFPVHGAMKIAAEIRADELSGNVQTPAERDKSILRSQALHAAWNGDKYAISKAILSGKFNRKEQHNLIKESREQPLAVETTGMGLDDFQKVYESATSDEKQILRRAHPHMVERLSKEAVTR